MDLREAVVLGIENAEWKRLHAGNKVGRLNAVKDKQVMAAAIAIDITVCPEIQKAIDEIKALAQTSAGEEKSCR